MNADGTGRTQLTETAETYEYGPAWSPDGARIAFARALPYDDGTFSGYNSFDVYSINADGTDEVRLTDSPTHDSEPAWSPDGSRIAFSSARDGRREIYAMDASPEGAANVPARLTNKRGGNTAPDWSPDGARIVFESGRDRPRSHDSVPEIYTMNADGSEQARLTRQGYFNDPDWSPDGKRLVFARSGLYTTKSAPISDANRPRLVVAAGRYDGPSEPDWQTIP